MTIILDTTVYYSDPYFKGIDMIILKQLCYDGKLKLIIPQIVHQEFKSQEKGKFIHIAKQFKNKIEVRLHKSICSDEKKYFKRF